MNALAPDPGARASAPPISLDDARIDAFVARASGRARSSTCPQWSRAVERGSASAPIIWSPSGRRACVGCLPLTEIRSRLFGNALVSAGFGTGGGILADDAARRRRARRRRLGARRAARLPDRSSCAAARSRRAGSASARRLCRFRPRSARRRRGACSPRSRAASAPRCAARSTSSLETTRRQRPPPPRRPFPRLCRKRPQSRHAGLPARPVRGGARRVRRRGRHPHRLEGRPAARQLAQLLLHGTCQPYWGGGTRAARALARQRPRSITS